MKKILLLSIILISTNSAWATNRYDNIVGHDYMTKLCYRISPDVAEDYKNALKQAINNYNMTFSNSTVMNLCYNSGTYLYGATYVVDVIVGSYGSSWYNYWLAKTDFPSGFHGTPGEYIKMNTDVIEIENTNYDQLVALYMHEIGHSIGIMHTDKSSGKIIIPTERDPDPSQSIFNSGKNANIFWFSNYDIIALEWMYQE